MGPATSGAATSVDFSDAPNDAGLTGKAHDLDQFSRYRIQS
jgi:hypothetical protein